MKKITDLSVRQTLVPRAPESYKGTFGHVLVVAGNEDMGGAAILAASAAVYSGAGVVTTATHPSNKAPLLARLPESLVVSWEDKHALETQLKKADVVLLGPGFGVDAFAAQLLKECLHYLTPEQLVILDGDALTLVAESPTLLHGSRPILTPHLGEWRQLSGLRPEEETVPKNKEIVRTLNAGVVLKKHRTEIYFEDNTWENPLGNPGMATGGMGDVLAGMIAGFTAQYDDKEKATLAAVYLHSRIGEELFKKQHVTLPSQIVAQIPFIMKKYQFQRLPIL